MASDPSLNTWLLALLGVAFLVTPWLFFAWAGNRIVNSEAMTLARKAVHDLHKLSGIRDHLSVIDTRIGAVRDDNGARHDRASFERWDTTKRATEEVKGHVSAEADRVIVSVGGKPAPTPQKAQTSASGAMESIHDEHELLEPLSEVLRSDPPATRRASGGRPQ